MTTSVYPAQGGVVNNAKAATFIPEIWSDEVTGSVREESRTC